MRENFLRKKAFTLIELIVVIAIIGLIASVTLAIMQEVKESARDVKRQENMGQLAKALQLYHGKYGEYPDNTDSGDIDCWDDWDAGNDVNGTADTFIKPLEDEGLIVTPRENTDLRDVWGSRCIYRYIKYIDPCCGCTGTYAILYTACENDGCPTNERPACCTCWGEGTGINDPYDITIFLPE